MNLVGLQERAYRYGSVNLPVSACHPRLGAESLTCVELEAHREGARRGTLPWLGEAAFFIVTHNAPHPEAQ